MLEQLLPERIDELTWYAAFDLRYPFNNVWCGYNPKKKEEYYCLIDLEGDIIIETTDVDEESFMDVTVSYLISKENPFYKAGQKMVSHLESLHGDMSNSKVIRNRENYIDGIIASHGERIKDDIEDNSEYTILNSLLK